MDSDDGGGEEERTPKKVKFPEVFPLVIEQISLLELMTGATTSAFSHKKG